MERQTLYPKPVVFIATANERRKKNAFLRNLGNEFRGIEKALDIAQNAGLCEIVTKPFATIDDIIDVFQDPKYKDRIAVFHYGGHAENYGLLLEDYTGRCTPAHKDGLVPFLARQKGLTLVFLNGCSTEQHALDLKNAGIPAVIGTSQWINDKVATNLSIRFYDAVGKGHALESAWLDAEAYLKTQKNPANFNEFYVYGQKDTVDSYPWRIYFKEGAERIKAWNLPEAAHSPLFGLPSIEIRDKLPDTPFLFLNRYRSDHAPIFFGRSTYIRELYTRITDNKTSRVILLYGQSGVGKSSLLDAGLLPRLEWSHTVLYVRRNQDMGLITTLKTRLQEELGLRREQGSVEEQEDTGETGTDISELWKKLEEQNEKPLVVILDQVEEVFTAPNKNLSHELTNFLLSVTTLLDNPSNYPLGKLVLGYRKEYHSEIDEELKRLCLDRSYLFLEPLNRNDIMEVVTGLTMERPLLNRYNLQVEDQLPVVIADDLLEDTHSPVAPVLQILLTKMWKAAQKEPGDSRFFNTRHYQELRKKGLLIKDFFREQMNTLRQRNKDAVDSGLALDILKFHTTPLGTACLRDMEEITARYSHCLRMMEDLVQDLKDLYLLTDTSGEANETGLAHDTLAPTVIREYNNSDQPGQRAARALGARIKDFERHRDEVWLNENDLKMVEIGRQGMRTLTETEEELVAKSQRHYMKKKAKTRRNKFFAVTLSVVVLISLVFAIIQMMQSNLKDLEKRRGKAVDLLKLAELKKTTDPTMALRLAEAALKLDKKSEAKEVIKTIGRDYCFYKIIIRQEGPVLSAALSPNGTYIATGSRDGTTRLWNMKGTCLKEFHLHTGEIKAVAFSPDGKFMVTGSSDKTAEIRDLKGNPIQSLRGHNGGITSVCFSRDGGYILTGSTDEMAILWKVQGGGAIRLRGHKGEITGVGFSPDGKGLVTASTDGTVRLWTTRGEGLQTFQPGSSPIQAVVFSPDGRQVLTGLGDGSVHILNLEATGQKTAFIGHSGGILSVAVSRGGRYILTGASDKTARLWDMTGNELMVFRGHEAAVEGAVFSGDGEFVFTWSADGTVRRWKINVSPENVLNDTVCEALSKEQKRKYGIEKY